MVHFGANRNLIIGYHCQKIRVKYSYSNEREFLCDSLDYLETAVKYFNLPCLEGEAFVLKHFNPEGDALLTLLGLVILVKDHANKLAVTD